MPCSAPASNGYDALLGGAVLAGPAVATAAGSIQATILIGWPSNKQPIPLPYNPTQGIETATNSTTVCPSTATGPCEGSKLNSPAAPTSWPPPAYPVREINGPR